MQFSQVYLYCLQFYQKNSHQNVKNCFKKKKKYAQEYTTITGMIIVFIFRIFLMYKSAQNASRKNIFRIYLCDVKISVHVRYLSFYKNTTEQIKLRKYILWYSKLYLHSYYLCILKLFRYAERIPTNT